MKKSMSVLNRSHWLAIILMMVIAGLAYISAQSRQHYMLLSVVIAVLAMTPFFLRFEHRKPHAREIVLIALLAAIAAISRVPFAVIPSVQPTSFVIIISALALGAESGFMIGAIAALVSNLFLGQGVWTPFQMLSWGMMGFSAGLLRSIPWMQHRFGIACFGLVWGFLFGWLMNGVSLLSLTGSFTWEQFFAIYAASVYFDLLHALSNFFFLSLFGMAMLRMMRRFRKKYGLLA